MSSGVEASRKEEDGRGKDGYCRFELTITGFFFPDTQSIYDRDEEDYSVLRSCRKMYYFLCIANMRKSHEEGPEKTEKPKFGRGSTDRIRNIQ